nr:dnaJ homolog subfamily B member 14-like [Penaeus vannamei]
MTPFCPGDMTAEELFNMFFGGGYPGGNVYVRRGGRWERAGHGGGGPRYHGQQGHHHQAAHSEQSNLSVFLQLMPLLLILLLSLASSLLSSDPTYSLSPTRLIVFVMMYKYFLQAEVHIGVPGCSNVTYFSGAERVYQDMSSVAPQTLVSYYVKPDFSTDYQGSIRRLEQHVEEDYVSTSKCCFKEKNYKHLQNLSPQPVSQHLSYFRSPTLASLTVQEEAQQRSFRLHQDQLTGCQGDAGEAGLGNFSVYWM